MHEVAVAGETRRSRLGEAKPGVASVTAPGLWARIKARLRPLLDTDDHNCTCGECEACKAEFSCY
jgi:hypothetical protein